MRQVQESKDRVAGRPRRGVTLIELLVVITLMLLVSAMTLPQIRPMMENRRVRDSARTVYLMLSGAKCQAMANGRMAGIMIDRDTKEPRLGRVLTRVESPPAYGGDIISSVAKVTSSGNGVFQLAFDPSISAQLVQAGDEIQLNHQGAWYRIQTIADGSATIALKTENNPGQCPPWLLTSGSVPFKIIRQPMKSSSPPLLLQPPAVIDLSFSGTEEGGGNAGATWGDGTGPVTIVFASSGAVERVYYNKTSAQPNGWVFLMVGKRANIGGDKTNLEDLSSVWVAINCQSGALSVGDAALGDLATSRKYAREGVSTGGN